MQVAYMTVISWRSLKYSSYNINILNLLLVAVILEPRIIKSVTVSFVSTSICHEVMGPNAMILVF